MLINWNNFNIHIIMKKTTIAANRLIKFMKAFLEKDKVDLKKAHESIMLLFDESNFIKLNPIEKMDLLKKVTANIRYQLDTELELAESNAKAIKQFKKEPYISEHKEMKQRDYDFFAMHNIEFMNYEN